jgi:hypothetical protein
MLDIRDMLGFSIFGLLASLFASLAILWRFEHVMWERKEKNESLTLSSFFQCHLLPVSLQHVSLKTRNTCLSFFSGFPLHSKVLRTQ